MATIETTETAHDVEYHEAIVVGAGLNGMYQLHRLRQSNVDAIALEANDDVGGTWFNNRYPGCRFDVESYSYAYFFNKEVIDEWDWKELFSGQPDNYRYVKFVADKIGIREHITFNTSVSSAIYDEAACRWDVTTNDGRKYSCTYLIFCVGLLSCKSLPDIKGRDNFAGPAFHTIDWPHAGIDLTGKRVAVIGTGSSGVQVIQTIAEQVDQLYVFQRRPNWCAPLNNSEISQDDMNDIRGRYDEIMEFCRNSPGGLIYQPDRRGFFNVSREERVKTWDALYSEPGFGILFKNFVEIFMDEKANAEFSEYIAEKIRARIDDPEVARNLIPTDHGFGVQRVPLESYYYEAFNRDNVKLINLQEEPITEMTENAIRTDVQDYDVDIIVYATGFNAGMGSYLKMDIRGTGGQTLQDKWSNGPKTLMGIMVNGFPNLLMPVGPQSGAASVNYPRAIEMCVDWSTDLINYAKQSDISEFQAEETAEEDWCKEARRMRDKFLSRNARNWVNGVNPNQEGKGGGGLTEALGYNGGNPKYRKFLNSSADNNYDGISFR